MDTATRLAIPAQSSRGISSVRIVRAYLVIGMGRNEIFQAGSLGSDSLEPRQAISLLVSSSSIQHVLFAS